MLVEGDKDSGKAIGCLKGCKPAVWAVARIGSFGEA